MTNYLSRKKPKVPMIYDNWNIYSKYQYGGLIGSLMKYCHIKLERNLPKENYNKVLEIGPGPHPHVQYINHGFKKYYILERKIKAINQYKKLKYNNIIIKNYKSSKIPFKNNFFDRIIMSHVLEHIISPEEFIFEVMSFLQ